MSGSEHKYTYPSLLDKSPLAESEKNSGCLASSLEQIEQEIPPKPVSTARVVLAKLRNLRRKKNVTLTELARRTGMTKANLSRLENSGANVTLKTLDRYARALNVELVVDVKSPRHPAEV